MRHPTQHPPELMTAQERLIEVASILLNGLIRLRQPSEDRGSKSTDAAQESEFGLAISGKQSVHSNTVDSNPEHA